MRLVLAILTLHGVTAGVLNITDRQAKLPKSVTKLLNDVDETHEGGIAGFWEERNVKKSELIMEYCKLDTNQKTAVLSDSRIDGNTISDLLNNNQCASMDDYLDIFRDVEEIQGKLDGSCGTECQATRDATLAKLTEAENAAKAKTNSYVADAKTAKTVIDGLQTYADEYQAAKEGKTYSAEELQEGLLTKVNNEPVFNKPEYAAKKEELIASIKAKTAVDKKGETDYNQMHKELKAEIKMARVEAKKEVAVAEGKRYTVRESFKTVRKGILGANRYEAMSRVSSASGSIVSALTNFEKGDAKSIVAGAADLAVAVSNFMPPPYSMFTSFIGSTLSAIFSPTKTVSQTIIEEFKKQKEYLEKEFAKLTKKIEDMGKRLEKAVEAGTVKTIKFISATTMRELKSRATSLLENIILKKRYIDSLDEVDISNEMAIIIANDIEYFGDTKNSLELQSQLDNTCTVELQKAMWNIGEFGWPVRKSCVFLFETLIMVEQYRSIVVNQMMNTLARTEMRDLSGGYFASENLRRKNFDEWLFRFLFAQPKEVDRTSIAVTIFSCSTELWSDVTKRVGAKLLLSARGTDIKQALDDLANYMCPEEKGKVMMFAGNSVKVLDPFTAYTCDAPNPPVSQVIERSVGGMVGELPVVCGGVYAGVNTASKFNTHCYSFSSGTWTDSDMGITGKGHRFYASSISVRETDEEKAQYLKKGLYLIGGFNTVGTGYTSGISYSYSYAAQESFVMRVDETLKRTEYWWTADKFETCSVIFSNSKIAVIGGLASVSKVSSLPSTPFDPVNTVEIYDTNTITDEKFTKSSGPPMTFSRPEVEKSTSTHQINVDMQENRIACGKIKTMSSGKEMIIVMSKTNGLMTYETLEVTDGVVGKKWNLVNMKFDDGSSDVDNYYAQFVETANPNIPMVTMTSTTEDDRFRTKLYKLKCVTLSDCSMIGTRRCAEDGTCGDDARAEVYSNDKIWPYTAFRVNDDTFPSCSARGLSGLTDLIGI